MPTLRTPLFLAVLASLLAGSLLSAQTGPKIATINVAEIRPEHHVVKENIRLSGLSQEKLSNSRISQKLEERKANLDQLIKAFQEAQARQAMTPEELENLRLETKVAQDDFRVLHSDWQKWRNEEIRKLNQASAIRERKSYDLIQSAAQKIGAAMGFDLVVDINGGTSTQLPVILYLRNGTDISKEVIAEINKDAPAEEPAPEVADPQN